MNEQFRIAQKLGLMFRADTPIPKDIKAWALAQLHANSPALGISGKSGKVKPYPKSLEPSLELRVELHRKHRTAREEIDEKFKGDGSAEEKRARNLIDELYPNPHRIDETKFAHRNVYGEDQLKLRFMTFWTNHFTMGDANNNSWVIGHAMDEAILANLNSSFSEMLYKVTTHPAMLLYLDNHESSGQNSKYARDTRSWGGHAGINDNLGRELLELHTVSPAANYTEKDVRSTANVLAGWGAWLNESYEDLKKSHGARSSNHWDMYKTYWLEPEDQVVLGQYIKLGKGGLRQLTDFLGVHENTVLHISQKLSQHFVSDNPSTSDINYIANAWRQSNGNLDQVHTAVIERAIMSKDPKFQWPITWLFQVIRLSEASYFNGWEGELWDNQSIFTELGQSFFNSRQPNGYSSQMDEWFSGEMFERRIRFSDAIYTKGRPKFLSAEIMDRIGASDTTRRLVMSAGNSQRTKFITLMCSPEIMGLENA
jgi:uncharacterized protein (DUF1800 family)